MRKTEWSTEYSCRYCNEVLSYHTIMYSSGRCPKCGIKGNGAGTIINHSSRAVRYIYYKPWYIFWQKPVKEYKKYND